MIQMDIL